MSEAAEESPKVAATRKRLKAVIENAHLTPDDLKQLFRGELVQTIPMESRAVPMPPPPLVKVCNDAARFEQLQQAARLLEPDCTDGTAWVRQCLAEAGLQAPAAKNAAELAAGLIQAGWRAVPNPLANPIAGMLYVTGDHERVGVVVKVAPLERRRFFNQASLDAEARRVAVGEVAYWLVAPGSCASCWQRDLTKPEATVAPANGATGAG